MSCSATSPTTVVVVIQANACRARKPASGRPCDGPTIGCAFSVHRQFRPFDHGGSDLEPRRPWKFPGVFGGQSAKGTGSPVHPGPVAEDEFRRERPSFKELA